MPKGHELRAELQLRTILEEAWGEIDHKYRYELTRSGKTVPPHIETGFRDLGLYLQAAARQADHLCEDVDRIGARPTRRRPPPSPVPVGRSPARGGPVPAAPGTQPPATLRDLVRGMVGFEPTSRTLAYIERRLAEHSFHVGRPFALRQLQEALNPQLKERFTEVYREVLQGEPFRDPEPSRRDLDVVPLVNFAIFSSVQSKSAAEAGLKATLRSRPQG